jgi:hypothetical protein
MLSYGFSIRGKSHVEAGIVCQDSNMQGEILPGLYLAVAADGVGSARHSDIASGLAVKKLVEYVKNHTRECISLEKRPFCLKAGFRYAESAIESYVQECGGVINEYDTTLHAVLYDGKWLSYGHAGDGGILIRTTHGMTQAVTTPQKGSDGVSVMPLRAGEASWQFGICQEMVASVLLVTDGVLDGVIMPYLLNLPAGRQEMQNTHRHKSNVYLSATEFFMNPYCVMGNRKLKDPLETYRYFLTGEFQDAGQDWNRYLECLKSGYRNMYGSAKAAQICQTLTAGVPLWNLEDAKDDKTVVCLINEGATIYAPDIEYFYEPDWAALRRHYEQLMYPSGLSGDNPPSQESDVPMPEDGMASKPHGGSLKNLFHRMKG